MHEKSERQVELETALEEISQQKQELAAKAVVLREELNALLEEEQYALWGLTKEEYQEAKREAYPDREVAREVDALQSRMRLLHDRSNDTRKSKEAREAAATEYAALSSKESDLLKQLEELSKKVRPLNRVINDKRRAKNLAAKKVQTVTAQTAGVGAKTKKRGE